MRELDEFDTAALPLQRVLQRAGLGSPDHRITLLLPEPEERAESGRAEG
jgi:hypothetical protein